MVVKGFLGTLVGVIVGGQIIKTIGSTSSIPSGLRSTTQSLVGIGILGNTKKSSKNIFKFKWKNIVSVDVED